MNTNDKAPSATVDAKMDNKTLVLKVRDWVDKLCKTGGRAWSLSVPVNFDKDPDMLIEELCKRYESLQSENEALVNGQRYLQEENEALKAKYDRLVDGLKDMDFQMYSDDESGKFPMPFLSRRKVFALITNGGKNGI